MRGAMLMVMLGATTAGAQPVLGPPVELDPLPLYAGANAVPIRAMKGKAVSLWLPNLPCCTSLHWAMFERDGGVAPRISSPLGGGVRYSPSLVADPDAGMWLLVWPDDNSGGQTAVRRVNADGGLVETSQRRVSASYTSVAKAVVLRDTYRVFDRFGPGNTYDLARANLAPGPVTALNEITTATYDVVALEPTVAWGVIATGSNASLRAQVGTAAPQLVATLSANDVGASTGPGELFFVFSNSALGTLTPYLVDLDGGVRVAPSFAAQGATAPSATFDGTRYWVAWKQAPGRAFVRRLDLNGVPIEPAWQVVDAGLINLPSIAALSASAGWLTWSEADAGGNYTRAMFLSFFDDAGVVDAGEPDAGFDAGGPDAGVDAGEPDAGVDAGEPDAGVDAGEPDAGVDAGEPDAGVDAGEPDAGVDAGEPDAGVDAGEPDAGVAVLDGGPPFDQPDAGSFIDTPDAGPPALGPVREFEAQCGCGASDGGLISSLGLLSLAWSRRRRASAGVKNPPAKN